MLKKTITYKDLDGNDVTEDFYFNLSKAEIAQMELSRPGGLAAYLQKISDGSDPAAIIHTFRMLLADSVGQRSEDGKRFIKTQQIIDEFLQTDAYSTLFMELVTSADAAAQFIVGVVPKDLSDKLATMDLTQITSNTAVAKPVEDVKPYYTEDEYLTMPKEKFDEIVGTDPRKMTRHQLTLALMRRSAGK